MLTKSILIFLAALGLAACTSFGDSNAPITGETLPALEPRAERTLVIVLPGIQGNAKEMKEFGIGAAIQAAWPHADVLLTNATFAYYKDSRLVDRLHQDVVTPAREAGYHQVWLAGASMGGLGALLYEREHPDTVTGIVLFAPFLGEEPLQREIREAGGVRKWNPGPVSPNANFNNYQRQVWLRVQAWAQSPELARRVWLGCGTDDFLRGGSLLLATALPEGNFIEQPGGHTWATWAKLSKAVFSRIPRPL